MKIGIILNLKIFDSHYGSSLIKDYYHSSLYLTLKSIYPEYKWVPFLFQTQERYSSQFWSKIENQRKYLNWLSNKLNFNSNEDWYKVNKRYYSENNNGSGLLKYIIMIHLNK